MQFTAPLPFGTSRVPNPFLLFLPVFVEESPAKRIPLKPFKIDNVDGDVELVYTGDCGPGLHILCAALLARLFDLLLMPLPDSEAGWGDLRRITAHETTTIKDLARSIRIDPEEPRVH